MNTSISIELILITFLYNYCRVYINFQTESRTLHFLTLVSKFKDGHDWYFFFSESLNNTNRPKHSTVKDTAGWHKNADRKWKPYYDAADQPIVGTKSSFQCSFCPAVLYDKFCLRTHMSQNHGKDMRWSCHICGKGYETGSGLNRHMVTHQRKFPCPICDALFTQKSSVKDHLRNKHKSAQCQLCSQILSLQDYNEHIMKCG